MSEQELPPPLSEPLPSGDWLFKSGDLVFGPIPGRELVEKLQSGELPPSIMIAREGGAFTPLTEVTVFVKVAAKASAKQRVDEEVREEASRRRRGRIRKLVGLAAAIVLGVGGAAFGVLQAVRAGYFDRSFEELAQIEILDSPPLVRAADPRGVEELEYLDDPPGEGARTPRTRPRPAREMAASRMGAAAFDQGAVQAVVQQNQNRLHGCLKEQVAREPGFRGEVPLTFTVGNQGRVVKLWLERRGYASGPLFSCMEAELGRWKFPAFDGERPSVSLSFRVGG